MIFGQKVSMKNYVLAAILLTFIAACTTTKHQLVPRYGFDFKPGDRLVIARFQNAPHVSDYATQQILQLFQDCSDVEVVHPDTVQDFFYRNLMYTDPTWEVDAKLMIRVQEATKARYLLVGKFVGESVGKPPVAFAEQYATGQLEDINENWVRIQFTLYDLSITRTIMSLQTRTKANQYNHEQDDGDITSFYAPVDLLHSALKKSTKKLADACHCN